jgi:DNA-directed RNA polymerase II subunit RPB2
VRQQLDSFNEFVNSNMQEIVDEGGEFRVRPESQYIPGEEEYEHKEYKVTFGQIYLSKPTMTEADGETCVLFPREARLRNLT